jgi:hypothetical protein
MVKYPAIFYFDLNLPLRKFIKPVTGYRTVDKGSLVMTEPWCKGISPQKEKKIKRALESTCELCREYTPLSLLELHGILPEPKVKNPHPKEREQNILVVCLPCHHLIHEEPVPVNKLKALITRRLFTVRQEILRALGYVPKPYSAPDDVDFSRLIDDNLRSSS